MKLDLVMWTFNGAKTLSPVLNQLNHVIPSRYVGQKLIVDDGSTDETVAIAKFRGWKVIHNEGKGISDGANTALKNVRADYFASFEQDLLLSPTWFSRMQQLIESDHAGACSGVRFADKPIGVHHLQRYVVGKYRGESSLSPWLRSRKWSAFTLGKSIDNTLYRTEALLKVGGFPDLKSNVGVDTALAYALDKAGYSWPVDYHIQSVHLRQNLHHELTHQEWYGSQLPCIWRYVKTLGYEPHMGRWSVAWRLFNSPLTGAFVAFKTKDPTVAVVHPLMRLYFTKGLLKAGGKL